MKTKHAPDATFRFEQISSRGIGSPTTDKKPDKLFVMQGPKFGEPGVHIVATFGGKTTQSVTYRLENTEAVALRDALNTMLEPV